ncbi:hypothetical protein GBA52_015977 [Prunus armeniaca]|nr:hypothetical protein GBA52_015977 [Prunus armeniaca]
MFNQQSETKLLRGVIFHKHHLFSTVSASDSSNEGIEQKEKISVTFVDKDGDEIHIKVPTGMSMLEAAHENDIDLEGKDMDYYNKLEDPTDEENDMLDLAFGLTESSRLGCQVIAKPELDGIRLAIPAATRNFAVDGYCHELVEHGASVAETPAAVGKKCKYTTAMLSDHSAALSVGVFTLCHELVENGASVAETPAAVGKNCKYTTAMLSDPSSALSVVFGKDEVLEQICAVKGYVDMSTVDADIFKD